jgi:hypothetical protein
MTTRSSPEAGLVNPNPYSRIYLCSAYARGDRTFGLHRDSCRVRNWERIRAYARGGAGDPGPPQWSRTSRVPRPKHGGGCKSCRRAKAAPALARAVYVTFQSAVARTRRHPHGDEFGGCTYFARAPVTSARCALRSTAFATLADLQAPTARRTRTCHGEDRPKRARRLAGDQETGDGDVRAGADRNHSRQEREHRTGLRSPVDIVAMSGHRRLSSQLDPRGEKRGTKAASNEFSTTLRLAIIIRLRRYPRRKESD